MYGIFLVLFHIPLVWLLNYVVIHTFIFCNEMTWYLFTRNKMSTVVSPTYTIPSHHHYHRPFYITSHPKIMLSTRLSTPKCLFI